MPPILKTEDEKITRERQDLQDAQQAEADALEEILQSVEWFKRCRTNVQIHKMNLQELTDPRK